MEKAICYLKPDGLLAILIPVRHENETSEESLARAWINLQNRINPTQEMLDQGIKLLDATYPVIVSLEDIPQDRYFRNAWRLIGNQIEVDIIQARVIHLEWIRTARNAKLAELDVETMKAVGKGDNTARDAVEAQKQVLRDIPQTFDLSSAKNPEELRGLWPPELNI